MVIIMVVVCTWLFSGNKQRKNRTVQVLYKIIIFTWNLATNFQIVSNGSTARSRALQIFNKLLKSPFDISPATCRELIPWGCFHHDILNLFHEDDFTMTFSSLANNVKYFFLMSNYPVTSFWVGAGEMVFSQFSSWRSVADQQGTGLGWHSCCQGSEAQRHFPLWSAWCGRWGKRCHTVPKDNLHYSYPFQL